jgi:hypothetical protein
MSGDPLCTDTETANTAAKASRAPAMQARISVSLVDMKILASPASTIFVTNSEGAKYAIENPSHHRWLVRDDDRRAMFPSAFQTEELPFSGRNFRGQIRNSSSTESLQDA